MSNIFAYLVRKNGGGLLFVLGTGVIVDPVKSQGLNLNDDGAIHAENDAEISHYHQGLPFTAEGRLVVSILAIRVRFDQGIPFDANNRIVVGGSTTYVDQGLGYDPQGGLGTVV